MVRMEETIAAAQGRWSEILSALGIHSDCLVNRHGPCPGCGGSDRFRYDDRDGRGTWICGGGGGEPAAGDGLDLLRHVHGWTIAAARDAVAEYLGLDRAGAAPGPARPVRRPTPPAITPSPGAVRDRLRAAWAAALPLDAPAAGPASAYFRYRGLGAILEDLPADLRLEPAAPYYLPPTDGDPRPRLHGRYPALLAVVRDVDGRGVAIHRTYIDPDGAGKATITDPETGRAAPARKLRTLAPGASRGAAIRLYPLAETLIVAEGIETAIAARIAVPELPAWAAVSSGGIARLRVPPGVREVIVAADHDPHGAGERAARDLAGRLRADGVTVRMAMPEVIGDWADVLAAGGAHG